MQKSGPTGAGMPRILICVIALLLAATGCTDGEEDGVGSDTTEPAAADLESEAVDTDTVVEPETDAAATDEPEYQTVYLADFESPPDDAWSAKGTEAAPAGDRTFLGRFTNDVVELRLTDLPPHDAVTVSFDLYVIGPWGEGRGERWGLFVNERQVVNTTFSNSDRPQTYPDNVPLGPNPGGSEALETNTLGYGQGGDDCCPADAVYRIDRTFLHRDAELSMTMAARGLPAGSDQSWGIDNVEVIVSTWPERQAQTNLVFEVAQGRATISGQVPTVDDHELVEAALQRTFGDEVDEVDLDVEPGPPPLWLYSIAELAGLMRPSTDLTLRIDDRSATAVGSVRTERWRQDYTERLSSLVDPGIETSIELDVILDGGLVADVEGMRLLFAFGSAELTAEHEPVLDRMVELLAANPELVVRIEGHTDGTGERLGNRDLSLERAQAALDYLVAQGADPSQLDLLAAGEQNPEAEERTDADRAMNRRVAFIVAPG